MWRSLWLVAWFGLALPVQAQQEADFPIDAAYRARILDGVRDRLAEGYFDVARAELIRKQLSRAAVRASYDTCASAASLSSALTADLQSWSHDRHLRLVFSVEPRPIPLAGEQNAADSAAYESAARRNFGFPAMSRLTGNVGYLELGRFESAALAGETLAAAMRFLSNTDALIIDLRNNGGGHADMVALITSYFLREQRQLATLVRREGSGDQIWSTAYVSGPRYLDRPIYVLTSSRTFSGAEGLAYDLRYFAQATLVGERTRGGANPGAFQQLDEHFAVFVPTARVVHASTNDNWDAAGIAPDVAVPAEDASRTALKLALETLLRTRPLDRRFPMWRDAYDDMFPTTKGAK